MFFLAANAPGHSAFNRVERRMVKFSKELSGAILEHNKFGTHLDANGVTVDKGLVLKNFENTGYTLDEIRSGLLIDGNPVVAEFMTHLILWGRSQKSGKHVTFGNRNISYKL